MLIGARVRRILWRARQLAASAWGLAVTAGAATLVGRGWFPDLRDRSADAAPVLVAGALGLLVVVKMLGKLRSDGTSAPDASVARGKVERQLRGKAEPSLSSAYKDLELGAALVVAIYVTFQMSGGLRSPVYPLLYALTGFLITFHTLWVALPLLLLTFGMEGALWLADRHLPGARELVVSHAAFIGFFALGNLVFLHGEVMRQRREGRLARERALEAMREEARDFRLISSSLAADPKTRSREADEERLAIGAVETIHLSLFYTLELLKKSLALHTCVLLWLDESGERLKIKELCTDSDCIAEVPLPADAGALGTVVKNRLLVNLKDPKRGHLPYYSAPPKDGQINSFVGVPILEDGHLRGVLCADRKGAGEGGARPFTEQDEALLQGAAAQMLRALQSERVFAAVERAKYEHERFFAALAKLNRALGTEQVCRTTFEAAREICEFDFAAVTLFDPQTKKHTVLSAAGEVPRGLEGASVDRAGLASMVIKNKHFLPAGGELRDKDVHVYGKKVRLAGMESLLVLPLICADEAIGSFAVAARRPRAFDKNRREMLGVIANHVAVSLANAQMYGRMETMATTDGLTGLVNHRTFQERIVEMLARAERSQGRQALLLTDIDHFKKVNDTYGHPTGDIVLRGVAQVVRDCVRKVDLAARYGGEEFAIVLEGTDAKGARMLAERIRGEVQKQVFQPQDGQPPFSVTISLGIAVYPDDGRDKQALIANADQALYHAKHNGRNRAVAFAEIHSARLKAVK